MHRLVYFDIPGKAEAIRLALHISRVPFEDVRLERDAFMALKSSGQLLFGQVPMLETPKGTQLVQSAAIMRYFGRLTPDAGLYPADLEQVFDLRSLHRQNPTTRKACLVDSLLDEEADMFTGVSCAKYKARFGFGHLTPEDQEKILKSLNTEVFPKHVAFLDKLLAASATPWLAGTTQPSIADIVLAVRVADLHRGTFMSEIHGTLDAFPSVLAWVERFYAHPDIVAYYDAKAKKVQ